MAELSRRLGAARTDSERAECVPPCHGDARTGHRLSNGNLRYSAVP
eukprot:SAG25_NODE_10483_length_332_cov_1.107296_1_plen_45_part_01